MKNIIRLSALIITTSIIFSSCESNLSLTKRHYTSGYYVDYSKNAKGLITKTDDRIAHTTVPLSATIAKAPVTQKSGSVNPVGLIKAKVPIIIATGKNLLPKLNSHPAIVQNSSRSLITINSQSKEANPILAETPTTTNQVSDGGERAALSLLWLVIVIILILWLIGLIAGGFGLGGFINLLLVIALILLILWLCRII